MGSHLHLSRRTCLAGALAAAAVPAACARRRQGTDVSSSAMSGGFAPVRAVLERAVADRAVPWAALLVTRNGENLFVHAEGAPLDHVDVLRSATKIATVTCVMTLVEAGALKLEDRVARYIPSFAGDKADVTVRHLLSMNSGLPASHRPFSDKQSLAESADVIARAPLVARPGEQFVYGNLGLTVAGRVAEIVSGRTWEAYFDEAVAGPLGMTFTYGPLDTGRLGGGGRTTLDSYGRLLKMHLAGGRHGGKQVLSEALVAVMQASNGSRFRNPFAQPDTYGYGMGWWFDRVDPSGRPTVISDPGAWGAYPWIDLDRRYGAFLFVRKQLQDGVKLQRALRPLIEAALDA